MSKNVTSGFVLSCVNLCLWIDLAVVVGRVQHFSLNTTLKFMHLSCWMSIVQHDLQAFNCQLKICKSKGAIFCTINFNLIYAYQFSQRAREENFIKRKDIYRRNFRKCTRAGNNFRKLLFSKRRRTSRKSF